MAIPDSILAAWLNKMSQALLKYDQVVSDNWKKTRDAIDKSTSAYQLKMIAALNDYTPADLQNDVKNEELRQRLKKLYTEWAGTISKQLELKSPPVKAAPENKAFQSTAEQRAAVSLNTAPPPAPNERIAKLADRVANPPGRTPPAPRPTSTPRQPVNEEVIHAGSVVGEVLTNFLDEHFPNESPGIDEFAAALAESAGIEGVAATENLGRNLHDMISKHANDLGDAIQNPRPDRGKASPAEVVTKFKMGEGGKGNAGAIRQP